METRVSVSGASGEPEGRLLSEASFGASRNSYGSPELEFPLWVREAPERERPALAKSAAGGGKRGTLLLLPQGFGFAALLARSLRVERVESGDDDVPVKVFTGTNFALLVGPVGSRAVVRGTWFEKAGRWSSTRLVDVSLEFVHEREEVCPKPPSRPYWKLTGAREVRCPPRPFEAGEVTKL